MKAESFLFKSQITSGPIIGAKKLIAYIAAARSLSSFLITIYPPFSYIIFLFIYVSRQKRIHENQKVKKGFFFKHPEPSYPLYTDRFSRIICSQSSNKLIIYMRMLTLIQKQLHSRQNLQQELTSSNKIIKS